MHFIIDAVSLMEWRRPVGTANLFATKSKRQEHRAEKPNIRDLVKKLAAAVLAESVRQSGIGDKPE